MVVERNKTYVATLRVRSATRETLSLQLRMNQALASLDLHPTSMPPSAIAFIRKLRDPAPGSLNLQVTAGVPLAWGRAVAASLDQIVSRAARPALEHVSAGVDAVLFVDRAELLACLAADWCDGSAITRWWWQTLFRAADVSSAVVREWMSSIEYVPAAFAKLAQREMAITVVNALPPSAVSRLVDEITRHFGLTGLRDGRSAAISETQSRASGVPRDAKTASDKAPEPEMVSSSEAWEVRNRWVPEAFSPRLEISARVLLAVALMLERAPTRLREHGFASRLLRSIHALNISEASAGQNAVLRSQEEVVRATDLVAVGDEMPRPLMTSPKPANEIRSIEPLAIPEAPDSENRVQHDSQKPTSEGDHAPERERVSLPVRNAIPDRPGGESLSLPVESALATPEHKATDLLATTALPQAEVSVSSIELSLTTRLGGVFYLINVALALDLYGDFTRPLEPGIELSIWDFLALIGRDFAATRIESDPIWALLARLAGRDEIEEPGTHFKPPDEWRMPPRWLNAFPEHDEWSYHESRDRLIVRHPAGFAVLDLKLGSRVKPGDVEARLAIETRCYSNIGSLNRRPFGLEGFRVRKGDRGHKRWTWWISDYLRVRLARALRVEPADDLTTMLLMRAARVEVSPARLDVFFGLAELPVEIRLAGLDRDPGWVPAAGRAIAFHYD